MQLLSSVAFQQSLPFPTFLTPIERPVSIKPASRRKAEQISSKVTTEDVVEVISSAQTSSQTLPRDTGCDDDKGKMMEDVMKTYIKQQEKLHTILQKKQHLQMVWHVFDLALFCLLKPACCITFCSGFKS